MSNKHIAIGWAKKQVNSASGFIYSDQFFRPFTNLGTRRKIVKVLFDNNVIAWTDTKDGAFLFRRGDPRLLINTCGDTQAGIWMEDDKMMILPLNPM